MHPFTIRKTCLNGWWDFLPIFEPAPEPTVPREGWRVGQYLVPSFWTKSTHGVRRRGETYYRATRDPAIFASDDVEFLFDAFGYPPGWGATRAGWVRRSLTLDALAPGRRYALIFDAVMPRARVFVNGQAVAAHTHPTLPLEADVTPWLRAGENEIAVLIEDYERDAKGRALVPTGNVIPCDHSGVWQDVWLVERGAVYLSDVTIRTSTRRGTLDVIFEVYNATGHDSDVELASAVLDWRKDLAPEDAPPVRSLPSARVHVPAGQAARAEISAAWPDAEWWQPENPRLYWLRTTLAYPSPQNPESEIRHQTVSYERFGFREVWIEGPDLMLNGYPLHLASDWGHKSTPYYYTEGWIRQWFGMMRAGNLNHSRLHTHPHPPITLDLADEEGILITDETGLHGSGGAQAAASPAYWAAARDHVRRLVRRDKNHPSVILWSVENEMRWNTKGQGRTAESVMIQEELPRLRALFNALDPTRPAYHDGDSSLWNEAEQPIISRHYGKEVAGVGWWDRERPLHSGEMALYHYAGPNNTLHLGGDAVYASFRALDEAAARDAALIIEAGRTLGVCCFGPWNLSCLENLRMEPEDVALDYDDFAAPGVKPLRVPAHSSEFSFWRAAAGYTPNHSFAIQARAFRPVAVIDRCRQSQVFAGRTFRRELFVINDGPGELHGELVVGLKRSDGSYIYTLERALVVARGRRARVLFETPIPELTPPGLYEYTVTLRVAGEIADHWARELRVAGPLNSSSREAGLPSSLLVYGPGALRDALDALGVDCAYVDALDADALAQGGVLLMEPHTVRPGSAQNRAVRAFVRRGGRLVLMEQGTSLFPTEVLEPKPVLTAFVRAPGHPVLEGLDDRDFAFWGEDAYPLLASDAYVARKLYRKDDGRSMLPLLESGEGGFGSGDLDYTPLFEAREGAGLILACQLRVTEKLATIPAAAQLLRNLLRRAATYRPAEPEPPLVVEGSRCDDLARLCDAAEAGRTVLVNDATPAALRAWGELLDVPLRPRDVGEVYQVVRREPQEPLLSGISNDDTCGVETFSYAPRSAANFRVGTTFLEPVPGLEALLVTPTESCLRELFVYGGRSEALRAHTLSRFLHAERRAEAVALGRVPVGRGQVLFNQFAPPPAQRVRFARFYHRLLANLGHRFEESLLSGEATPSAESTGPGYPQQLYAHAGPCDEALRRQMVQSTRPSMERMLATPILNLAPWTSHTAEDGVWRAGDLGLADDDPARALYLYYPVWSPAPRKNVETNLDVPNPEALTFVDLAGRGTVEITINGHTHAPLDLGDGGATLSDVPLEMGGNHILVRWLPGAPDATLAMRWRNIMRQPEVSLQFGAGGSAN